MTRPLQSDDPLASLLMPAPAGPGLSTEVRSATVRTWDNVTGSHTVALDGTVFTNLAMFRSVDHTTVRPGDVVTLLGTRDSKGLISYGIVGVWRKPPF